MQESVPSAGHPFFLDPSGSVKAERYLGHLDSQSSSASSSRPFFELRMGKPSSFRRLISSMAALLSSGVGRSSYGGGVMKLKTIPARQYDPGQTGVGPHDLRCLAYAVQVALLKDHVRVDAA